MIIFIHGEDTFRSRRYLHEQIKKFKQARDPQGFNTVVLDGKKEPTGKLINEMVSVPFLAEKRLVVVENILSTNDKDLVQLIEWVQYKKIPESNVVIFWQGETLGKIKEIKTFLALLEKQDYVQKFDYLKGSVLNTWIQQEVLERGGSIDSEALNYMVQVAEFDMWALHHVIDQLVALKHKNTITIKDVVLFVSQKIDDDTFRLVETVVGKQTKHAFELITRQRQKGFEEQELFGLLIWNIRILLQLRDIYNRNDTMTSDMMAKETGVHPFVVKKNFALIKRYSLDFLQSIYQKLLDIDIKTKTGFANQSVLLDVFVAEI